MNEFWIRADSEDPYFRGDETRSLTALDKLVAVGILKPAETLGEVECDACGEAHIECVTWLKEPAGTAPRAYIWCPVAGRVAVERGRLEVWRIDCDRLADMSRVVLGLPDPTRVLVAGRAWLLGAKRFGERMRDVFLIRGAAWQDGRRQLDSTARLRTAAAPLILIPYVFPRDPDWTAGGRVVLSMSEFDWFGPQASNLLSNVTETISERDRVSPTEAFLFRRSGPTWDLSYDGNAVHLPDMLGLSYIAELLRRPRTAIEAAELAGAGAGSMKLPQAAGLPMADEATINAVRADLVEKESELTGLAKNDWTRRGTLKDEISKLEKYLRRVKDRRGRARKVAGTAQRSRTSVTNAIRRAVDEISAQHPDLANHLKASIKTGAAPIYQPTEVPDWRF